MSDCCLFKRILWTARTLHEASVAISLVSNPSFSNALIKICCAAFSCGAIVADKKVLTGKKRKEGLMGQNGRADTSERTTGRGAQPQGSGNRPR